MKQFDPQTDIQTIKKAIYASYLWIKPYSTGSFENRYWQVKDLEGNNVFAVTIGIHSSSIYYTSGSNSDKFIMAGMYREYAHKLLPNPYGLFTINNRSLSEVLVVDLNRTAKKDELKKRSIDFYICNAYWPPGTGNPETYSYWQDNEEPLTYFRNLNSDYQYLIFNSSGSIIPTLPTSPYGYYESAVIYYQPGIIVFDPWSLMISGSSSICSGSYTFHEMLYNSGSGGDIFSFSHISRAMGERVGVSNWTAQTNMYLTNYFCRAYSKEYNYSSNPTYVNTKGEIIITSGSSPSNRPSIRSYIASIGLYDSQNNLLAVAKTSKPIKKDFSTERVFKVALSF